MDSMRTPWILEGVHGCISYSLHRVHMESRETLQNIMDSVETPCGLSVDSMRAASLIYLIKKNLMIFKNKCSQRELNSDPFSRCTTTHQTAELNGHVSIGLFRKYIMPTSHD